MNGKKILVTGGAGFIGSHLCERLLATGGRVLSVDSLNDFYDPSLKRDNLRQVEAAAAAAGGAFQSIEADIRDAGRMDELFKSFAPDIVVHIAAYAGVRPSIENPALYYDVNVNGTVVLLECMKRCGVSRMVFASSSSVYGNNEKVPFAENDFVDEPISPYAATKKAGELLCHVYHHLHGMNIACLRFFTVYGPRQRPDLAIRKFTELILNDKAIPFFGDGNTQRDYTYIDDIIDGVMGAVSWVDAPASRYGVFNLGESRTISLSRMVETIENALGKKARLNHMPNQPGDVSRTFADISKAREQLGYAPSVEFEDGVSLFVDWLQAQKI